jgi:hypothetical protein
MIADGNRKAGNPCLWCGEIMDHNCSALACGNCCGDLGMICHESPAGYRWLMNVVMKHTLRLRDSQVQDALNANRKRGKK